jgi:hypothetical protein
MSEVYDSDSEARPVAKQSTRPLPPRFLGERERHESEVQDRNDFAKFDYDTWRATRDVDLVIHVDGPKAVGQAGLATIYGRPVKRRYVLKPGDEVAIPRIYRNAIQRVEGNEIVGGLCPSGMHLVTANGAVVVTKIAPAIDPLIAPRVAPNAAPEAGRAARLLARAAKGAS